MKVAELEKMIDTIDSNILRFVTQDLEPPLILFLAKRTIQGMIKYEIEPKFNCDLLLNELQYITESELTKLTNVYQISAETIKNRPKAFQISYVLSRAKNDVYLSRIVDLERCLHESNKKLFKFEHPSIYIFKTYLKPIIKPMAASVFGLTLFK